MRIEKRYTYYSTIADTDVLDLTADVQQFVTQAGIEDGLVSIFVPGSTAAVTALECDGGAVDDLKRAVERLAPPSAEYQHDLKWWDANGHAHVRAALLGPSLTVPVIAGKLDLGTRQQIVLCDFDSRPRRRRVVLQVIGS